MRIAFAVFLVLAASSAAQACPASLDHELRPLAGRDTVRLCEQFDGQVLLLVNTASKCGFTPQYEGLEALNQRFSERGFSVLGFPSNDFMGQEPGSEEEIAEFCELTYGVQFPMFQKISVKEGEAHPLYQGLAEQAGQFPQWNFHKYLVDRNGSVIGSFGSRVKPDDASLVEAIEQALAEGS